MMRLALWMLSGRPVHSMTLVLSARLVHSINLVHSVDLVQPEILVVVDTALHTRRGGDLSTTTEYVREFWSAVNLRFRSLTQPRVELVVVRVEVGSTLYLQSTGGGVEVTGALDRMGQHYYTQDRSSFDLVVTLTGEQLCRRKSSSSHCNTATAGYAYVGGACVVNSRRAKVNSVELVQDHGGFDGVLVAVHELAHLLGHRASG